MDININTYRYVYVYGRMSMCVYTESYKRKTDRQKDRRIKY